MKTRFVTAVGIAAVMLTVPVFVDNASAGAIVIDDFTQVAAPNPWPVQLSAQGDMTINETGLNVLGGTRRTYIEAQSVGIPGIDFLQVSVAPGVGLFDYNSTVDTDGILSLTYDGTVTDFSGLGGIEISFASFDFANAAPMPVTLILFDGTDAALHTLNLNAPGAQSLFFDFNNFAGVDLTSIASIQFTIDPAIGADFRIAQIMAIPAPAGLALLALGVAMPRRRRRS